jgi:ribosomal protein S18 acetylase RimI-like enzyme
VLIFVVEDIVDFGWYDVARVRESDISTIHDIDSVSLVSTVSAEWLWHRFRDYRDKFLVARKHETGEVIGYLSAAHNMYYPEQLPGYVYLSRFAVACKYRRCGVGTALLSTLYDHLLESQEYRGVVADVRKSNISSLRFFTGKHWFFEHHELSRPRWYEHGETEDDRYKIVVYKPFGGD